MKSKIYVCPICGNTINSMGDVLLSCCGVTLPALDVEEIDEEHQITVEMIDGEVYVRVKHFMKKDHYISFIAYVNPSKFEMIRLYPEGNAEARFFIKGGGMIYFYCNKHGLFRIKIDRKGQIQKEIF